VVFVLAQHLFFLLENLGYQLFVESVVVGRPLVLFASRLAREKAARYVAARLLVPIQPCSSRV
jgi:hypothetical protein